MIADADALDHMSRRYFGERAFLRRGCRWNVACRRLQRQTYSSAISRTLGLNHSVIETPHARHSNVCNSGNPPIFGIERTNRMAVPQLGQHGAGW
jgi:hypothetical protein